MRLRYQLAVAVLIVTLMTTSFLAGRQFQSVSAALRGERGASGLIGAVLAASEEADRTAAKGKVSLRPLETFQEVLSHLRSDYVSALKDEGQITYGAVRGMLAMLRDEPYHDRYSRFLDPQEYRSFLEENEGHFGGIGAEIGVREVKAEPVQGLRGDAAVQCPVCGTDLTNPRGYQIVVIAPLPESPAQRAGIQAGDAILRVDDAPTAGMGLSEAVRRIKGPPGTSVNLTLGREGLPQPLQVKVTRAVIDVRSVDHQVLPGEIGYLRITTFNDTTVELVGKALDEFRRARVRGVLLDLRNDPGGGLEACIEVAGLFVGPGPIVHIEERAGSRQPRTASKAPKRLDLPLVVLINNGTASAAEILAGAIQDYGVGKLVGVATFGKGLVQTVFPLRDGSALALTTARYLTPKLRDIERKGITPDQVVEQPKTTEYIPPLSAKDAQGRAALDLLRKEIAARGAERKPVGAAA